MSCAMTTEQVGVHELATQQHCERTMRHGCELGPGSFDRDPLQPSLPVMAALSRREPIMVRREPPP